MALDLSQTAINKQLDSVYVTAIVRWQKRNGLSNLVRGAGATERYVDDLR